MASSVAASSRSWSAVRARVAATPGPSSSSSTGSTRWRTRDRVKRGSSLCGSDQNSSPCARQACSVWARVTSSRGRRNGVKPRHMPARARAPEPRVRPSRTVSAWSSRVCPSSTTWEPNRCATSSSTAYLASRAAASGPWPREDTSTRTDTVSSTPRPAICSRTRLACSADPACSPWSTVTPTTCHGRDRASKVAAATSASESAPPEQATSTGWSPTSTSPRRTASRTAATAGSSAIADLSAVHAAHPGGGVADLGLGRQVRGLRPDGVEVVHPDLVDDRVHEGGPVAVLRHLGVQAQQPAQHAVEVAGALAALVELRTDVVDRRDDLWPDAVHHDVGVALEQRHDAGEPVHDLALLRGGEDVQEADVVVAAHDVADAADPLPDHRRDLPGVEVDAGDQAVDLAADVVAHPRHGGELHAVGLLVQADPEPEVRLVDVELLLHVHDVGRDEQQAARRRGDAVGRGAGVEGVELPEHLRGHEPEQAADLQAVDL